MIQSADARQIIWQVTGELKSGDRTMATEQERPEGKEKKKSKLELRDLKPKKEVKGGSGEAPRKPQPPPPNSGEIDFMGWD